MKMILVAVLLLLFFSNVYAGDSITVHKDARLNVLVAKQAAINKLAAHLGPNGQYKGYRLQVITTRSRDDAFKAKATLLQNFPDEKVYITWQSPYFRVRVGNFIERPDAELFKEQISKFFTDGVYTVDEFIDYTPVLPN
jgi:hypothetical protein